MLYLGPMLAIGIGGTYTHNDPHQRGATPMVARPIEYIHIFSLNRLHWADSVIEWQCPWV